MVATMRLGSGQETRDRIVSSAVKLFARQGFHATSVQAIVEGAQATKGAFYHHFNAKEDVLFEIIEFFQLEFGRRAAEVVAAAEANGSGATETIGNIVAASLELYGELGDYNLVWVSELRMLQDETFDSDRLASLTANAQANLRLISQVIRRGIAAGEFRPLPDLGAVAIAISSLPMYHSLLSPGKPIDVRTGRKLWADFFIYGMKAHPAPVARV
jgi:TetR/AcrR family transcriptional regulator, cholesterol catabolism regulator